MFVRPEAAVEDEKFVFKHLPQISVREGEGKR